MFQGCIASSSALYSLVQQVEKDVEAAREAHTENDDFDDWYAQPTYNLAIRSYQCLQRRDLGVHRDVALKNEHAVYGKTSSSQSPVLDAEIE